jgi:hypothetical protein
MDRYAGEATTASRNSKASTGVDGTSKMWVFVTRRRNPTHTKSGTTTPVSLANASSNYGRTSVW